MQCHKIPGDYVDHFEWRHTVIEIDLFVFFSARKNGKQNVCVVNTVLADYLAALRATACVGKYMTNFVSCFRLYTDRHL